MSLLISILMAFYEVALEPEEYARLLKRGEFRGLYEQAMAMRMGLADRPKEGK